MSCTAPDTVLYVLSVHGSVQSSVARARTRAAVHPACYGICADQIYQVAERDVTCPSKLVSALERERRVFARMTEERRMGYIVYDLISYTVRM